MKRSLQAALFTVLLTVPAFVPAQSARELYAAANAQQAEDDKRLNAAYEALLKEIRANNTKERADFVIEHLRDSQRAWLKFREAQEGFVGVYTDIGSSSARTAGLAQYNHELTEARTKDLADVPSPF